MKLVIAALLGTGTLCISTATFSAAPPEPEIVCTGSSVSATVPSGVYVDGNGRRWVGFNPDGTPPDSLAKDSQHSACTENGSTPLPPPPLGPGPQ